MKIIIFCITNKLACLFGAKWSLAVEVNDHTKCTAVTYAIVVEINAGCEKFTKTV